METRVVDAVTVQPADRGDSESLEKTLEKAADSLGAVVDDTEAPANLSDELMSMAARANLTLKRLILHA